MDHATAIETHAAERYLLNELSDIEANDYEEHYFDCAACAENVRDGVRLMDGGREIVTEEKPSNVKPFVPGRRTWRNPWAQLTAAAMVMFGLVGGGAMMNMTRGSLSYVGTAHVLSQSRGPQENRFKAKHILVLNVDIQSHEGCVRYDLEILDANGKRVREVSSVTAEETTETISVGTDPLPVGTYTLSIIGVRADGNRAKVEERVFHVVE